MSGKDLIDDYLSELMDDPDKGAAPPAAAKATGKRKSSAGKPSPEELAETVADSAEDDAPAAVSEPRTAEPTVEQASEAAPATEPPAATETTASESADSNGEAGDPLAAFRTGGDDISEDEFEAMLDAMNGPASGEAEALTPVAAEVGDPLEAFRSGSSEIGDDEFEAMLDALQGKAPTESAAPAASGDPLQAFRDGGDNIGDDEFEAMLDALSGKPNAVAPAPQPTPTAVPVPPAAPEPTPATSSSTALPLPVRGAAAELLAPNEAAERRRRAEDKVSSWLRFNIGVQCFAVEVLKVQEVLRVPSIMPVRGTGEAMLGVMNLRGQIVPVMDTGIRLGFGPVDVSEASRVVVLEESGDSLGLLVSAVADVINISDMRIERISGTPSLVNAEVVRGISRREGGIIVLLDATRMLAL